MNLRVLSPTRSTDSMHTDSVHTDSVHADGENAAVQAVVGSPRRGPERSRGWAPRLASYALRLVVVACLAIDAYVHLVQAHNYDPIRASVSQGTLFRYEATAAIVAGALLLITGRTFAWIFAFLVLAAGFAAVMIYQYVDIGAFGPFPEMYDPYWTFQKGLSAVAEGTGALLAGVMVGVRLRAWWRRRSA
jgi:hypothetical protein